MKLMSIFFLLFSFHAFAGDGAGNGGGTGEKNLVFAFFSLKDNISKCLDSNECKLTEFERGLLIKIREALGSQMETIDQIKFHSEKREPGFFVLNKTVRSARTGDNPGDKIYINIDHLYKDTNGTVRPIGVVAATALLVHELSHHFGIRNDPEELKQMDILCAKLSAFLSSQDRDINYSASTDINGLFRKNAKDFETLRTGILEHQSDFIQTCDPTEGEDSGLKSGCAQAFELFKSELKEKRLFDYTLRELDIDTLNARYSFVRQFDIHDGYICELTVDISVTLENRLESMQTDLYCDR